MAGALQSADICFEFRKELSELQVVLQHLCTLLGHLAGDRYGNDLNSAAPESSQESIFWSELKYGIPGQDLPQYLHDMNSKESAEVEDRRRNYKLPPENEHINAIGLALSGGGIRSATFAQGVLQVLARKGVLKQVDFLSTVSGGGYTGAFISTILSDKSDVHTLEPLQDSLPFGSDGELESAPLRHLRNHSKYLIEGGWRTIMHIGWLLSMGLFISLLLISPFPIFAVLISYLFGNFMPSWFQWVSIDMILTYALLLTWGIAAFVHATGKICALTRWGKRSLIGIGALAGVLLVFFKVQSIFEFVQRELTTEYFLLGSALFPLALLALAQMLGKFNKALLGILTLLTVSGPLLILATYFYLYEAVTRFEPFSQSSQCLFIACGCIIFLGGILVNINFASLHRYYRDRLARTYLNWTESSTTSTKTMLLSELNGCKKAPYHLICAALNLSGSSKAELRGRKSDFFLFSKHFCGSTISKYFPTTSWEKLDTHLDSGTAMAISGAAAAPNMGALTSARYTFLMALLNVRLGYWARNPETPPRYPWMSKLPPLSWRYFWRELSGNITEKLPYLNLSDGGHIENLAVYELLRRRCKFIIAVDGEADPSMTFGGLIRLSQLAKIDMGVSIDLSTLSDLRPSSNGSSLAHFTLFQIAYPGNGHGFLLYIKASMTGNESEFLKAFKADHPDFPHQSTADQFFDEMQFEAYRALGEHIAEDLFRKDLVREFQGGKSVASWFRQLAVHILGIPDPAIPAAK